MPRSLHALALLASSLALACSERPPPQARAGDLTSPAQGSASATSSAAPGRADPAEAGLTSAPGSAAPPAPLASVSPVPSAAAVPIPGPSLLDAQGKPLPQTDERPTLSPGFQARVERLFEAIVRGEPSIAEGFFFPVVAYEQVKAIKEPARDWKARLMRAYERDIRAYHQRLGERPEAARFLGVEVPESRAQWMKPGSEGNRVGYFRVLRSKLRYADAAGKEHALELTSMISWRGEWYVVHLNGFK